jgi:hypothetical protein
MDRAARCRPVCAPPPLPRATASLPSFAATLITGSSLKARNPIQEFNTIMSDVIDIEAAQLAD